MNRKTRLISLGVAAMATLGCLGPEPPPPPFNTSPYGPGLETESSGRRVDFLDTDGNLLGRFRDSGQSLRIYDENSAQLGRVRIAQDGYELVRLDGGPACVISVEGVAAHVACDLPDSEERQEVASVRILDDEALEFELLGELAGRVESLDDDLALFDPGGQAILTRQDDEAGQLRLAALDGHDTLVFGPDVSVAGALASFLSVDEPAATFELSPWMLRGAIYFATSRLVEGAEAAEGSGVPASDEAE